MKSNKNRREAFSNSMSYMQARYGFGSATGHLISVFPWASVNIVVDIGGGLGDTASEIVRNTSSTKFVVQDLPDVIAQAEKSLPVSLRNRISLMPHNFFEEQPVKDADVFFLRWVLHDWSDAEAIKILRALVPALRVGSHIIIQEFIVPESGTMPFYFEKTIR